MTKTYYGKRNKETYTTVKPYKKSYSNAPKGVFKAIMKIRKEDITKARTNIIKNPTFNAGLKTKMLSTLKRRETQLNKSLTKECSGKLLIAQEQ